MLIAKLPVHLILPNLIGANDNRRFIHIEQYIRFLPIKRHSSKAKLKAGSGCLKRLLLYHLSYDILEMTSYFKRSVYINS